jgi:hypothetical protein
MNPLILPAILPLPALQSSKDAPISLNLHYPLSILDPSESTKGEFSSRKESFNENKDSNHQSQNAWAPSAYYQRLSYPTKRKPYIDNRLSRFSDNPLKVKELPLWLLEKDLKRHSIPLGLRKGKHGKPLKIALNKSFRASHVYTQHTNVPGMDIGAEAKYYGVLPTIERGLIPSGGVDLLMSMPVKQTIGDSYSLNDKVQVLRVVKSKITDPKSFDYKNLPEAEPFYLTALRLAPQVSLNRTDYPIPRKQESGQASRTDLYTRVNSCDLTSNQEYDIDIDQADLVSFYNMKVQTGSPIFQTFCLKNPVLETEICYILNMICSFLTNYSVSLAELKISVIFRWARDIAQYGSPKSLIECVANKEAKDLILRSGQIYKSQKGKDYAARIIQCFFKKSMIYLRYQYNLSLIWACNAVTNAWRKRARRRYYRSRFLVRFETEFLEEYKRLNFELRRNWPKFTSGPRTLVILGYMPDLKNGKVASDLNIGRLLPALADRDVKIILVLRVC